MDELYVRFFRLAERRIAEKTGKGIVSFISNHSWISEPSFVVLRQHLLNSFDKFWIENMHGNRKTSEYAPDGRTSETVFALSGFSPGIQQGVAISLWVKTGKKRNKVVYFRDDLNDAKAADRRAHLVESLKTEKFNAQYEKAEPRPDNRFSFRPSDVSVNYLEWPKVPDFAAIPSFNGPIERRGNSLIVYGENKNELAKLADYFDPKVSDDYIQTLIPEFMKSSGEFDAKKTRTALKGQVNYKPSAIVRYPFKPFDVRLAYLDADIQPLFSRPSPQLLGQRFKGNSFFITRDTADKDIEGSPFYFSSLVCDYDCISGHARHFPIRLKALPKAAAKKKNDGNGEFGTILHEAAPAYNAGKITANLSPAARAYLDKLGIKNPDDDEETATLIWMHTLAIGYSPAYLTENADGVRQDWPRIPLPDSQATLFASAELGRQVAVLLNTEMPVQGVTTGTVRPELVKIAVVTRLTRETLNLSVTAGWGHAGKEGVTMPGKGKLETRAFTAEETATVAAVCDRRAEDGAHRDAATILGPATHDIFLNETACWQNVPEKVWDYTIGGYQVIKKWLSYREFNLLGRALTPDEAREVTHMGRRIAALILLQPELDRNYQAVKAATVSL
jgi:hypothetical protein